MGCARKYNTDGGTVKTFAAALPDTSRLRPPFSATCEHHQVAAALSAAHDQVAFEQTGSLHYVRC